jgi:uncharacterized integral membrane protein
LSLAPRPAGSPIRKIVAAVVLVPLAVVIIVFAAANRQPVTVSFDPFNSDQPAASLTLPLFALVILLLIAGVLLGGMASWLRHGKWRRATRRLEREVDKLRAELDLHRHASSAPTGLPHAPEPPERLQLKPPLH